MIGDFEKRFATILGGRLPAPHTGRVAVAPGPAQPPPNPMALLATRHVEGLAQESFGGTRPERLPDGVHTLDVLRLRCLVNLDIATGAAADRSDQLALLDAALWALRASDLRSGEALEDAADHGFLIRSLEVVQAVTDPAPLPAPARAFRLGIDLMADGLFWPPGRPPQAGGPILEARLRAAGLPVPVQFAGPFEAGGPAVGFEIRVPALASMRVRADGTTALAPGPYALAVFAENGGPAAGSLGGGNGGAGPWRLYDGAGGAVVGTYAPPAAKSTEVLVVANEDAAGGGGLELCRAELEVN